jgi:hypothetical protein
MEIKNNGQEDAKNGFLIYQKMQRIYLNNHLTAHEK